MNDKRKVWGRFWSGRTISPEDTGNMGIETRECWVNDVSQSRSWCVVKIDLFLANTLVDIVVEIVLFKVHFQILSGSDTSLLFGGLQLSLSSPISTDTS